METLSAYIPMDRRQALAHGEELPDRSHGAALFADISGFTPLTEALTRALGPRRGAEEVTRCLNEVYEALIEEIHRRGGSVIGFAGDAITCWFDGDSGLRATACGLAMQTALHRFASVPVPSGESVALAAKVAIATGPVRRFVVGDQAVQRIDVLAGATLERMVAAEHLAAKGEVVLDEGLLEQAGDAVEVAEWRTDTETGRRCAVVQKLAWPVPDAPWPALPSDALPEELTRPWLLPPVYARLRSGQDAFLAELRPTVALFLAFSGVDYDGDEDAPERLDAYIRWVQGVLAGCGGSLIQITVGDKGSYLYMAFGAPVAHGDDATRSVAAALELQTAPPRLSYIGPPRMGIAAGRAFCGATGGTTHRQYAVMGDAVNLAARLMQAAPPGGALAGESLQRAAARGFAWESLPPLRVKGKSEPVAVFRPVGTRERPERRLHEPRDTVPLVGREAELALVEHGLEQVVAGRGQILAITAEAGMGKSRLVAEAIRRSAQRQLDVYLGECQPYGTNISYLVWHNIWRSFFGLDELESPDEQVRAVEAQLLGIDPGLVARLPLLGLALNLSIPENDLTRSLDAKLRKESLEALLVDCLRARARTGPLLLVLEDCHWLDPLSHDLLEAMGRSVAELPVLLVLAYRPPDTERLQGPRISRLPWCTPLELTSLTAEEAERLIALKLALLHGEAEVPSPTLVQRVAERAHGNPFYIEELLNYLHDCGLDPRDSRALERLDLPPSLDSLILTRIDQLSESQKSTIKVASIIGRQFRMAWLWGAHPQIGTAEQIRADLDGLSRLDLTPLDQPEPERIYLFKHIVTREVAYESVPFGTRSVLHGQLGQFIEHRYADILGQYVDLLAYHYDLSQIEPKKREYLGKAGEAAQAAYANEAAIDYYRRLLPLLSGTERVSALIKLGQVLELVGEWSEATEVYHQALELAEQAGDERGHCLCQRAMGWLLRKRGEYYEAANWLIQARAGFMRLGDLAAVSEVMTDIGETNRQLGAYTEARKWYEDALSLAASVEEREPRLMAQAQALKGAGTLAAKQGDMATSRSLFEQSLYIRRELDDRPGVAALLNNLGIIAYYVDNYAAARELDEQSLEAFRQIGDRFSASQSLNNLAGVLAAMGDYRAARRLLAESVDIQRQLGDMGCLALALNSLADVLLDEGDHVAARPVLLESLRINKELGDQPAVAYLLDDFSALAAAEGQPERALRLAGAAVATHDAIGSQLPVGEKARFDRLQAWAWRALDKPTAAVAWEEGRAMTLDRAVEYALEGDAGDLIDTASLEAGVA